MTTRPGFCIAGAGTTCPGGCPGAWRASRSSCSAGVRNASCQVEGGLGTGPQLGRFPAQSPDLGVRGNRSRATALARERTMSTSSEPQAQERAPTPERLLLTLFVSGSSAPTATPQTIDAPQAMAPRIPAPMAAHLPAVRQLCRTRRYAFQ